MACYLCYCECSGWRACMGGVLTWVVCLPLWRASVMCQRVSVGDVPAWAMQAACQGDVRAWVASVVHQHG